MTQPPDPARPAEPGVIEFAEPPIDLSDQDWTDAFVLALFWVLAFIVFLQFFTRYVLNDSIAWTEEIARYFLIGVTFVGAVMAVRKETHIAVEFLYRWLGRPARRVLQTVVDLVAIAFYALLAVYTIQLAGRTQQAMVSIEVPKSIVYWIVALCFVAMTLHALGNAWRHWRTGTSRLIDPEAAVAARPLSD
jgi:TRAP-type C4-dicarboxylate transport system permease small subunit